MKLIGGRHSEWDGHATSNSATASKCISLCSGSFRSNICFGSPRPQHAVVKDRASILHTADIAPFAMPQQDMRNMRHKARRAKERQPKEEEARLEEEKKQVAKTKEEAETQLSLATEAFTNFNAKNNKGAKQRRVCTETFPRT